MQIIGIWIILTIFGPFRTPNPKFGGPVFGQFFFVKISACGVSRAMPCDARSFCNLFKRKGPTQRLKTAKKSFLRPLWTPNPNFWYLIFSQFFSLFKIWACGVSRVMPCDTRSFCNLFKRKGTHSEAQNGKKVIFTVILDLKSQFFGHYEPLIGSLGFEKVA